MNEDTESHGRTSKSIECWPLQEFEGDERGRKDVNSNGRNSEAGRRSSSSGTKSLVKELPPSINTF